MCANHDESSLTLVDIDVPGSIDKLKECQKDNPEHKFICLSVSEERTYSDHNLKKPINSSSLIELLKKLEKTNIKTSNSNSQNIPEKKPVNMIARENKNPFKNSGTSIAGKHLSSDEDSDFFGDQKDISINNKKDRINVAYHPEKMLQGAIMEGYKIARKNNCAIQVTSLDISLVIDPSNFKVYTMTPERIIRPTCLLETNNKAQFKRLSVNHLKSKLTTSQPEKSTDAHCFDIDTLLWKVSLWSSRGRIPADTDLSTPVYLTHWPNLTRLDNIPHAPRIAALLISAPDTLCNVAEKLMVPQRYIFGFYSACYALDLSANARRQADNLFKPNEKPHKHSRSILSKIFRHITRKSQPSDTAQQHHVQ